MRTLAAISRGRAPAPARALFAATLACLLVCAFVVALRLQQPWMGLSLEAEPSSDVVQVVSAVGPAAEVETPAVLVAIGETGQPPLEVRTTDIIEEPDFFDTYEEMADFFERQSALTRTLRSGRVTLVLRRGEVSTTYDLTPSPRTPLGALPGVFWFQLVAGAVAFLISLWVFVLRPRELTVRIFAFIGATIPIFTVSAAFYGARELAIDGEVFRALSTVNHLGANLFGCGLVALFLMYPSRLVDVRWLWAVPAIFVTWCVLDALRVLPDQNWGSRAPIMLEMLSAIALGVVQWRRTRNDPRARAGLRWLGVSILTGSGLFVFSIVGSSILGLFPPMSQGYSFGFFLFVHASFALGLRRHRLFELDDWAYALLFWVLGGLTLVALDALIISMLDANPALSMGVTLLVCGFLYFPLRTWLWSKIVSRKATPEHELFDAVLQVTFATDVAQRTELWKALFVKLFDPIAIRVAEGPVERAMVYDDGIRLDVPASGTVPGLVLEYPWQGKGLFAPRHEKLAGDIAKLMQHAESRREAFERGVRDERHRIARDMHDDIGSGLLSSLYREDLDSTRSAIRQAIGDVRSIVHELTRRPLTLSDVVAEIRHETIQRLEAANIAVDWALSSSDSSDESRNVGYEFYRHCTSMFRELVSNVIRHAAASRVRVRVRSSGGRLRMVLSDDGRGFDPASASRGNGLTNLTRRARELRGTIAFAREDHETVVRIDVSIDADSSPLDMDRASTA